MGLSSDSSRSIPLVVFPYWVIVPDSGAGHIAEVAEGGQRSHNPAEIRVIIVFSLDILHTVFLIFGKYYPVFRKFSVPEFMAIGFCLQLIFVFQFSVGSDLIFPGLFYVMQEKHKKRIGKGKWQWAESVHLLI